MGLYVIAIFMCSMCSAVYANKQYITNANYMLLILCGGMTNNNDFSILYAIWILPAMVVALIEGKAIERECNNYKYIAPRYESCWNWYISEGVSIIVWSICCSALLIAIAMLICKAYGFVFIPLTKAAQGDNDVLCKCLFNNRFIFAELFFMNTLRFARIGTIALTVQMLPKYNVQISMISIMIIELVSFLNTDKPVILYTYLSACMSDVALPLAILFCAAGVLGFLAIGAFLFHTATTNGLV